MTGTTSRSELPPSVARLWDAARRRDFTAMQAHIDFAVAGIALIVHNMSDMAEADRDAAARSGLAELENAGTRADLARPALESLADVLGQATDLRNADDARSARARAALEVPRIPPGLSASTREYVARLAAGAANLGTVYELEPPNADADWLLVAIDDGTRVAPVRLARDASTRIEPLRW